MIALTDGFYEAFTREMGLTGLNFQFTQGAMLVPPRNLAYLCRIFDGIPGNSAYHLYNPNSLNGLSSNLANILESASGTVKMTHAWQLANAAYLQPANWIPQAGSDAGHPGVNPLYYPDQAAIKGALRNAVTQHFYYDSAANGQKDSNAPAAFWGETEDEDIVKMNQLAQENRLTVDMKFSYGRLKVLPGNWFEGDFLSQQYAQPGNWANGQTQWDSFFGPSGSLLYLNTEVFIATAINFTISSYAPYAAGQLEMVQNNSGTSPWPFFIVDDGASLQCQSSLLEGGGITVNIQSLAGAVQVLGFVVSGSDSYFKALLQAPNTG